MDRHPERAQDTGMEPTVGEELRLGEFLRMLERASIEELQAMCRLLARQALVVYPSAIRYLAREAAQNLSGRPAWSEEATARVMDAIQTSVEERA